MKVDSLPGLQGSPGRGTPSISFAAGGDFASKLTLGQIIKGRVLRSYEGSRYLVDFNGQQKVVDSAVPLRPDEVIYGRVVGLGERVELQRVNASVAAPAPAVPAAGAGMAALTGKSGELISGLFERFQAQLSPADLSLLLRTVERAPQPERMAQAGLVLSKLGVPLSAAALRAVFDTLRSDPKSALFALPGEAIHLATQPAGAEAIAPASAAFGALLREMLGNVPELQQRNPAGEAVDASDADRARSGYRRPAGGGQDPRGGDPDIARLILNVQAGGAVAHRVGTLPIFVDGRLVELNIALFEQAGERSPGTPQPLQHRQVVFAVTTEKLGRVEVQASIAGVHMRIRVSTESRASAQFLATHAGRLAADLETLGWRIDELAYQTTPPAGPGAVAQTVLEHLIAPGSVSALA